MPTVPVSEQFPEVHETGDFLVFFVDSDSIKGWQYRVDMQKFCGNGHCDCKSFCAAKSVEMNGEKITKNQALKNRALPNESLECKHINKVRRYLSFKILNNIIEDREKAANANKKTAKEARALGNRVSKSAADGVRHASFSAGQQTPFARPAADRNTSDEPPLDHYDDIIP